MSNIKIAFFDIDGTLIDMEKKIISEKVLFTLKRLKEKGIKICIATGRSPITLPKIEDVEFDAYLTFNGSYCFTREEMIFSNPIASEDVEKILENAKSMNRPVSIATKNKLGANGKDDDLVEYYSFANLKVEIDDDFESLTQEEIYQVMLGCYPEEYDQILDGVNGAKIAAWWDRAVDIIPANGGKGVAIERVLDFYGLNKGQAIAFGDGKNDIEMLQTVGTGVAMGNALDDVKSVADDVCESVSNDGVYYYCKEHNLI